MPPRRPKSLGLTRPRPSSRATGSIRSSIPPSATNPRIPRNHIRLYRAESAPDREVRADWILEAQPEWAPRSGRPLVHGQQGGLPLVRRRGRRKAPHRLHRHTGRQDRAIPCRPRHRHHRRHEAGRPSPPSQYEYYLPRDICSNRQMLFSSAWANPQPRRLSPERLRRTEYRLRAARAATTTPWANAATPNRGQSSPPASSLHPTTGEKWRGKKNPPGTHPRQRIPPVRDRHPPERDIDTIFLFGRPQRLSRRVHTRRVNCDDRAWSPGETSA